jgi:hypothetical protein
VKQQEKRKKKFRGNPAEVEKNEIREEEEENCIIVIVS